MRKTNIAVFVSCIAVASVASTIAARASSSNLIDNPGFEAVAALPEDVWGSHLTVTTSIAHSGSSSLLQTTETSSGGWDLDNNPSRHASVTPLTTYTASVWVTTPTAGTAVNIGVDLLDGDHSYVDSVGGTSSVVLPANTWVQLSQTFTPGGAEAFGALTLQFARANRGTPLYWDDMAVIAGASAPSSSATTDTATTGAPTTTVRAPTATVAPTTTVKALITTVAPASAVPPAASKTVLAARWVPTPGQAWQWHLQSPVDTSLNVPIYDIDAENPASVVATLHAAGRHVICYVDVGGAESYRADYSSFPPSVLGNTLVGIPSERYVDIRQLSVLGPIMSARLDTCKAKGFDAVEPDVLDAYANSSGFTLSGQDQINYNNFIAGLVHSRGMSVALKNDPELAAQEASTFDFSINEECVRYSECDQLSPFARAGKAVFDVEYNLTPRQFCPITMPLGIVAMQKNLNLDAWRAVC